MHVPDLKYLVPAAHSGEHDRLPESVWGGKSRGDCGAGHRGDGGEHGSGGGVLQGDGREAESVRLSVLFNEDKVVWKMCRKKEKVIWKNEYYKKK